MADQPLQQEQGNILVPVYDAPNTRSTLSGAGIYFEQSYINCWPEIYKPLSSYAAPNLAVTKRPGCLANAALTPTIASYGTSDQMVCLANIVVTQLYDIYIAAFFDNAASKIYIIQYRPIALTSTKIGEIATANVNDLVFITEITDGATLLPGIAVSYQKSDKSSGTGYYSISLAGVFTGAAVPQGLNAIASGSFPSNLGTPRIITGPFQHMNGHTYIMTIDGFIYESQLNAGNPDITSWNTNATVTASQYPDRGVGVYRYKHLLLACGQDSIEFWSPDNNAPPQSSLVRTDQAFIKFGATSPKMVINIDDVLYWVAFGSSSTTGVWQLDGYTPKKISTQREDVLISNAFGVSIGFPSYVTLETILMNGKKHLVFNGVTGYSLAYGTTGYSGADTYVIGSVTDVSASIQCFNITDQMWWQLNMHNKGGAFIMPATAFPSSLTAGQYKQYFFVRKAGVTINNQVSSTRPMAWVILGAEGTFYDDNPTGTPTTEAITVAITFNTTWNLTTKRKKLIKLIAMMDTLTIAGGDVSVYTFYFLFNKDGNFNGTTNVRGLLLPTQNTGNMSSRYSINNLGMYRQLNLGIVWKSKDAFRMQGLELEVARGTH
jgi:hypothetical protein